ncbi:MAG: tagatose 1,6-diphosphate aldolase [Bryobacteraceae bacterium]
MLSAGKLERMKRLANQDGVIAAAAMDQRGSLKKMLAAAGAETVTGEMMAEFKTAVTRILTPYASAILLDPELGLEAARTRAPQCGLLLAYEKSGYDNTRPGRLPELLEHVSVKRIAGDWQADAVKFLMHYSPLEDAAINDVKQALVERIGAECETFQIPFFLELVGYHPQIPDEKSMEYARLKPQIVTRSVEEFSKPHYRADVLKVEIPVNLRYVEGSVSQQGPAAYTKAEALEHFRRAAQAARLPFIYLSAGVDNRQFVESLEMAAEAGSDFSGVLCGRATWKEGVPVYVRQGLRALEEWLATEGVRNIQAVNAAIRAAKPWWAKLGLCALPTG